MKFPCAEQLGSECSPETLQWTGKCLELKGRQVRHLHRWLIQASRTLQQLFSFIFHLRWNSSVPYCSVRHNDPQVIVLYECYVLIWVKVDTVSICHLSSQLFAIVIPFAHLSRQFNNYLSGAIYKKHKRAKINVKESSQDKERLSKVVSVLFQSSTEIWLARCCVTARMILITFLGSYICWRRIGNVTSQ